MSNGKLFRNKKKKIGKEIKNRKKSNRKKMSNFERDVPTDI